MIWPPFFSDCILSLFIFFFAFTGLLFFVYIWHVSTFLPVSSAWDAPTPDICSVNSLSSSFAQMSPSQWELTLTILLENVTCTPPAPDPLYSALLLVFIPLFFWLIVYSTIMSSISLCRLKLLFLFFIAYFPPLEINSMREKNLWFFCFLMSSHCLNQCWSINICWINDWMLLNVIQNILWTFSSLLKILKIYICIEGSKHYLEMYHKNYN